MTKNEGRGHIIIRSGGIRRRVNFWFSERPDGRFDLTIDTEHKVVASIEDVARELGGIWNE